MRRHPFRFALHWLVITLMIATSTLAPAQALADAMAALEDAHTVVADTMPCDDMGMDTDVAGDEPSSPCDCCAASSSCDLSACLGTACLSALPRLVAAVPLQHLTMPSDAALPAAAPFDTPFRPPIG